MKFKLLLAASLAIVVLVLSSVSTQAAGTSYYVSSSSGSDTYPGTQAQPWKTIAKATNSVVAGDTVYLKRGDIWAEKVSMKKSGTASARITFDAYGSGNKPKITSEVNIIGRDYVTIRNWHVDGSSGKGFIIFDGDYAILEDVEASNSGQTGIFAQGDYITLRRVKSYGAKGEHGLYFSGSDASLSTWSENGLVEDSEFYNNADAGIQVNANGHQAVGTIVRRNKIYGNGTGMNIIGDENGLYHHNLIYNSKNAPVYLGSDEGASNWQNTASKNTKFYNNTIYNALKPAWSDSVYVEVAAQNIDVRNNIVDVASGLIKIDSGASGTFDYNCYNRISSFQGTNGGANSITGDPLFTDKAASNFHLQNTSPCIDKGVALGLTSDYDLNTVPVGAKPDIGAYEYQSGGGSTTTTTSTSSACPGDYDGDRFIGIADLSIFASSYKQSGIDCSLDLVNNDCYLNIADLSKFAQGYKVVNHCTF